MEGKKGDYGKLRYDLIPPGPLQRVAEVYTLGAKKYGDRNWEKGLSYGRVYAAAMRHLQAWVQGSTRDPDDGQHPLASVVWCALALMEYENTHSECDDRPSTDKIEVVPPIVVMVYDPMKPCPKCGWTCMYPEDNIGVCCKCHSEEYDGLHHAKTRPYVPGEPCPECEYRCVAYPPHDECCNGGCSAYVHPTIR